MTGFSRNSIVRDIYHSPGRFVVAQTAGGGAVELLLGTAGASGSLLEVIVPYASSAMCGLLGATPEHFCSARTSRAMAAAAFGRGVNLARGLEDIRDPFETIGVGCTASLASDRPKRGPHRVHVAYQTLQSTWSLSVELAKGARSRDEEDQLAGDLLLFTMAVAAGIDLSMPDLLPGENPHIEAFEAPAEWAQLLAGEVAAVRVHGEYEQPAARPRVLFPGSFNPPHEGHEGIAAIARERTGLAVEYELAAVNADKPPLDYIEINRRIHFLPDDVPLWLTCCATFVQKSDIFPSTTFIVGADTITRIADPRFYGRRDHGPQDAFGRLAENGARFIVFGREISGHFQTLNDLDLPPELLTLCEGISEDEFREDISSTELRRKG